MKKGTLKKATFEEAKKTTKPIVINQAEGLVFDSEEELYAHFLPEIQKFEKEFFKLRSSEEDVPESQFSNFEAQLPKCLEEPDEIWEDHTSLASRPVRIYIKAFEAPEDPDEDIYHVAICYLTSGMPSFVYLHFPTFDFELVEKYRRGEIVFDRASLNIPPGAIDGDALTEGDELACGLYKAMLLLRSDKDIPQEEFGQFAELREGALEEADEIWRTADSSGTILVTFIKEFHDEAPEEFYYVVVTLEDVPSSSHALLFSFPTNDPTLVDRYRHGENLQAEEVIQEASH